MKSVFYIFFFLMIALSGCKQDSDVVNADSSIKSLTANEVSLVVPEVICTDEEFVVSLESKDEMEKALIQISKDNGISWINAAESSEIRRTKSENFYLNLKYGNYKIRGAVTSALNGNPGYSEVIERTVSDCQECEGLVLDPDLSENSFVVHAGELKTFTAEYTVIACDKDYYNLKLSGELISKAVYSSVSPEGAEIKKNRQNTAISWNIGDVKKGIAKTFKVTFKLNVPLVPYGTLIPLTSGFILEGQSTDGSDVRAGDYNEIFVQVH